MEPKIDQGLRDIGRRIQARREKAWTRISVWLIDFFHAPVLAHTAIEFMGEVGKALAWGIVLGIMYRIFR